MTKTAPTSSDVRQWARSQGLEVGERGRLSPDLLAAYSKAHGGASVKPAAKKAPAKKRAAAKKAPAKKKAAVRKAPAKKAAQRSAPQESRFAAPPATRSVNPPAESSRPSLRREEPVSAPPVVAIDGARVTALEDQLTKLSARVERLEAARAATPEKRGLFSRK